MPRNPHVQALMAPWTVYKRLRNTDELDDTNGGRNNLKCLDRSARQVAKSTPAFHQEAQLLGRSPSRMIDRWRLWTILSAATLVLTLFIILLTSGSPYFEEKDVLQYVDPLIGTADAGHVFAGATLPFGMAKPVADVEKKGMAGFASDGELVYGFSHLHDSGTGGNPSLGNFPLFVYPHCEGKQVEDCEFRKLLRGQPFLSSSVNATPGYFVIELQSGVRAEMTATSHVALYRFSFRDDNKDLTPIVSADASDLLRSSGTRSMYVDAQTGRMTGEGSFTPSFGQGNYDAYFCADFQGAQLRDIGAFTDNKVFPGATKATPRNIYDSWQVGVYARFQNVTSKDSILARVGLSWLSIERACENAELELNDWDFDRAHEDAAKSWRSKLSPIKVSTQGVNESHRRNFWSGVYRAMLSPQDYSGENQLWNSSEPYFDSWYCIWDTFRGVHPFLTLIDPMMQSRMVRSLIDIYKHDGWLPECRMSFCKGFTQGGSNADVVLADGLIKGLPGINWTTAYEAVVKDAEEQPVNWRVEGRGGLKSWKELGYIPYNDFDAGGLRTRSVSRTFEYAYNDFCIAEMANLTGQREDSEKYSKRARNWKNLFREDIESMGFTNFPQPIHYTNGSWLFQNATLCSPINSPNGCFLEDGAPETYEGSPWLYQFSVPQDMAGLIAMLDGREDFVRRLDKLHDSGVLDMGDEQAFLPTFLYHYAGRPGLSAKRVHSYIPRLYNDTIGGIPGNDDSGSMGIFVVFSMLGFFPNAGQDVYFITPPFFPSMQITNPLTGKTATIRTSNFDPLYKRIYIQSATLNGEVYKKNWLSHDFFTEGGTLELRVGEKESLWGTGENDVPPSLSTGLFLQP